MKGITINRVSFGLAILSHGLLLCLGVGTQVAPPPMEERITFRFSSPESRPESAPHVEKQVARAVVSTPVVENDNQRHQPVMPLHQAPLRPMLPAPVAEPVRSPVPPALAVPSAVALPPAGSAAPVAAAYSVPAPQRAAGSEEQVREPRAITDVASAPRLADYLSVVRTMVEVNREYPSMARQMGLQGTVTVRVHIRGDGSIGELAVVNSSGHKSLDKAAVSAVRRSAPFRAPGEFGLGGVTVEIPIVYRLT